MITTACAPDTQIADTVAAIAAARRRLDCSISDAAEQAGVSRTNWSRYESHQKQPSWTILKRMARAVGLALEIRVKKAK